MHVFALPALLLLAILSTPLHAQEGAVGGETAFCGLAGEDLLASLEGSWSLTQSGGSILYPVPMPLPAQDPVPIRFTYDADAGVIDAEAADLSDGMILYPAGGPELELAEDYIAVGEAGAAASGCSWSTTPILIGTNLYLSSGREYRTWRFVQEYCELVVADIEENGDDGWGSGFDMEAYGCFDPEPRHEDFQMEMTLILRFQRPDYAAGMVTFEGDADGYGFGAQAPVTMSRD